MNGTNSRALYLLFLSLILLGTVGYTVLEGWSVWESAYMTIITLSTVGYGEVRPLSPAGQFFTAALIVIGVGTLAVLLGRATEALLERGLLRRRRMTMEIRRMRDHIIVCGHGRMGRTLVEQLKGETVPFVVVEKDLTEVADLDRAGCKFVAADATDDSSLIEAGIERARALATVLAHDADNLFVTLTARKLNPALTIIARSSSPKNDSKMLAAGATRAVNPYLHGGRLMARQVMQPSVTEFIDALTLHGGEDIGLEEVIVPEHSQLARMSIRDAPLRKDLDVIVVGIRNRDGGMEFNPSPDAILEPGHTLVVLGRRDKLRQLNRLVEGR